MMRLVSTLALGAALSMSILAMPAQAQRQQQQGGRGGQPAGPTVSKAFADGYAATVNLAKANNLAGAKDAYLKLMPANDIERYNAGILGVTLGQALNDTAMVGSAADMVLGSSAAKPEDKAKYTFFKGATVPGAAGAAMMVQGYEAGYKLEGTEGSIAAAYYGLKDLANGDIWEKRATDRLVAAGKSPVDGYRGALIMHLQPPGEFVGAQQWAKLLGGISLAPNDWRLIVEAGRRAGTGDEPQADLDMMRLMRLAKAMTLADNYRAYVGLAISRLPGEVVAVVNEGKGSGVLKGSEDFISGPNNAFGVASAKLAADKASLATIDKDAAADPTARAASGGADALLGYGDYAHAVSLYQVALTKSGVDANRVNARLGIAKANLGDIAGAEAAFGAVKAGPWKNVADYWLVYLQARGRNAPTA